MEQETVRELITRDRQGDSAALEQLLPVMYEQLRRMAARYLQGERDSHTLGPTAVVHEAYIRLAGGNVEWCDRSHFLAIAATVMRRVLVDYARTRNRARRGAGAARVSLEDIREIPAANLTRMTDLDEAITRLASFDERKARILELIYFGGLTHDECAEVLNVSPITIHRDLRLAKAWLERELLSSTV